MTFTTPQFILVLIAVLAGWYIAPRFLKKPALLVFSYYYAYLLGGIWTASVLFAVTLLTYACGLLLSKTERKKVPASVFTVTVVILLVYGRQSPVLQQILAKFFGPDRFRWSVVNMAGLSYYALSAISYIIDICRGKDIPDRNFVDLALWLSFFPKISAGPIERHDRFKDRLGHLRGSKLEFERIKRGLLICARGYFYKIVLANRMALFVDQVFADIPNNHGFTLLVTMIMFALEIYFDFAGYSLIAGGIAHAMDLDISVNFDHPYFAESIKELWERWHISLSLWLRDYIYIPLGGSRKGELRRYLNLIITFAVSGIWHGAGFTYFLWGITNAVFQIIEETILKKIKKRLPAVINMLNTFLAFGFALVFFRADSFLVCRMYVKRMFNTWNPGIFFDGTLTGFGLDGKDWAVLLTAFVIALISEIFQYKGVSLYDRLQKQNIVIRWCFYYLLIFALQIFGIYGAAFDINNFLYIKF